MHPIGKQMIEFLRLHRDITKKEARERSIDMLRKVGISNPEKRVDQYSFELSGGMRQRAMIAMALLANPSLVIADEPTTSLDVTIQAQILRLLKDLQEENGMSILFITHNLGVVAQIADEIAVMYLGRVVEKGSTDDVFHNPRHPYTVNLLKAIPRIGAGDKRLSAIEGQIPSPFDRPSGCQFHSRCREFIPGLCDRFVPEDVEIGEGHTTCCWKYVSEERIKETLDAG
jgi:peptide/nickel transport system ATP-binding protein